MHHGNYRTNSNGIIPGGWCDDVNHWLVSRSMVCNRVDTEMKKIMFEVLEGVGKGLCIAFVIIAVMEIVHEYL